MYHFTVFTMILCLLSILCPGVLAAPPPPPPPPPPPAPAAPRAPQAPVPQLSSSVVTIQSTSTSNVCNTPQGLLPVLFVPTHTLRQLFVDPLAARMTVTSTPTSYVTPPPLTAAPSVSISYVTLLSTVTQITSTSTVSALAGFQGVLQTGIPNSAKVRREAWVDDEHTSKRSLGNILLSLGHWQSLVSVLNGQVRLYPIWVTCNQKTVIRTVINTIYIAPAVTLTLAAQTVPASTTIVTTSTVSSTQTLQTAATAYAACASATNILGPPLPGSLFPAHANELISDIMYSTSSVSLVTTVGNTAYDCCVQCIQTAGCAFGAFQDAGRCFLLQTGGTGTATCPAGSGIGGMYVSESAAKVQQSGDLTFAVYNGYCGRLSYNGEDTS